MTTLSSENQRKAETSRRSNVSSTYSPVFFKPDSFLPSIGKKRKCHIEKGRVQRIATPLPSPKDMECRTTAKPPENVKSKCTTLQAKVSTKPWKENKLCFSRLDFYQKAKEKLHRQTRPLWHPQVGLVCRSIRWAARLLQPHPQARSQLARCWMMWVQMASIMYYYYCHYF